MWRFGLRSTAASAGISHWAGGVTHGGVRSLSAVISMRSPGLAFSTAAANDFLAEEERDKINHSISTRNPNLTAVTAAVADVLAPIVEERGHGDPLLVGPRGADWWTGLPPHACPGFELGQLKSMPLLNLQTCSRQDMLKYFDNTWTLTELLFASLQGEASFYLKAYHQLRQPLIFYYGHPAVLYVNKLRVAGLLGAPINAHYEQLFETGVDEMSWDDLSAGHTAWPALRDVHAYRKQAYAAVRAVIESHPDLRDGQPPAAPILADSPLWA